MSYDSSSKMRREGNIEYNKFKNVSISNCEKLQYLEKALKFYHQAYRCAKDNDDNQRSAAKNIAYTSFEIFNLSSGAQKVDNLRLALSYCSKALAHGTKSRYKPELTTKIQAHYTNCLEVALKVIRNLDPKKALDTAESFISGIKEEEYKIALHKAMFEVVLPFCIKELDDGRYGEALGYLRECSAMLKNFHSPYLLKRHMSDIKGILDLQLCRANAHQMLQKANTNLEHILASRSAPSEDAVFELIDWYNEIARLAEDKQLETTSMAFFGLERVYREILHNEERARESQFKAEAYQIEPLQEWSIQRTSQSITESFKTKETIRKMPIDRTTIQTYNKNSESLRLRGNQLYEKSNKKDISLTQKSDFLKQAKILYAEAFKFAKTVDEKAMAAKNMATTSFVLAETKMNTEERISLFKESLKYFPYAIIYGQKAKFGQTWHRAINHKYRDCLKYGLEITSEMAPHEAIKNLTTFASIIKEDSYKLLYNTQLIQILHQQSICYLSEQKYGPALHCLEDLKTTLDETETIPMSSEKVNNIQSYKKTCRIHIQKAKAQQLLHKADNNFLEIIKRNHSQRDINQDVMYDLIDWYCYVIKLSEGTKESEDEYQKAGYRLFQIFKYGVKDERRADKYKSISGRYGQQAGYKDDITSALKARKEISGPGAIVDDSDATRCAIKQQNEHQMGHKPSTDYRIRYDREASSSEKTKSVKKKKF